MEVPQNILQNLTLIEEQAVQVFLVTQCGMENIR